MLEAWLFTATSRREYQANCGWGSLAGGGDLAYRSLRTPNPEPRTPEPEPEELIRQ